MAFSHTILDIHSHNSLEWHEQSCFISIVSHDQVITKHLECYYTNIPNDIVNSWKWPAQCCLISVDKHNVAITKQVEWYYANTPNAFVKHKTWKLHVHCCMITIDSPNSKPLEKYYECTLDVFVKNKVFLIAPSSQSPFIHKWKGEWSRSKRKKSKVYNDNISYFCRLAYARSFKKSLDGVKDMEVTQSKKRTSSIASLTVVEKGKNKSNPQSKNFPLWLGFKAMNALNESQGLPKESHKYK